MSDVTDTTEDSPVPTHFTCLEYYQYLLDEGWTLYEVVDEYNVVLESPDRLNYKCIYLLNDTDGYCIGDGTSNTVGYKYMQGGLPPAWGWYTFNTTDNNNVKTNNNAYLSYSASTVTALRFITDIQQDETSITQLDFDLNAKVQNSGLTIDFVSEYSGTYHESTNSTSEVCLDITVTNTSDIQAMIDGTGKVYTQMTTAGSTFYSYYVDNYYLVVTYEVASNNPPSTPTSPLCEGETNPTQITDTTPEFSAVYEDEDEGDTAIYCHIQVDDNSDFSSCLWDTDIDISDITEGNACADISYAGSTLSRGTTYYWRIKYEDDDEEWGDYCSNQTFTINNLPDTPVVSAPTDESIITDNTPTITWSAFADDDGGDTQTYYEVKINTVDANDGANAWTSGEVSSTSNTVDVGSGLTRSDDYYVFVRVKDSQGEWSSWSATGHHVYLDGYPVNDSYILSNPYASNQIIADNNTVWEIEIKVTDPDGVSDLDYVTVQFANSDDDVAPYDALKFRWTESTDAFSELTDTQLCATLFSTSADSTIVGNQVTLVFKFTINSNFSTKDTDYAIRIYTRDDQTLGDTDTPADFYEVVALTLGVDVTSDNQMNFGTITLNTLTSSDSETIQNNGNVTEDIKIKFSTLTDGTYSWTLGSSEYDNGANKVVILWSINDSDWNVYTTYDQWVTIKEDLGVSSSVTVYVKMLTPTTSTSYEQYTTTITVGCVQAS